MKYGEELRRLGLKVEILSREIMVGLIEKVMCNQRHSEGGEGVRWISRERDFQDLVWVWALSLPIYLTLDK